MTAAIRTKWAEVRADQNDTHWVVCKATEDMKSLVLAGHGTGGFDEFMSAFSGAETVMYGGLRIRAVDERGSVKSVRPKFIKVALLPETLPAIRRAKANQLKTLSDELLDGTHATFDVESPSDITQKKIEKQLQSTCGAHQPSHYDFGGAGGDSAHSNATHKTTESVGPVGVNPNNAKSQPTVPKPSAASLAPAAAAAKPATSESVSAAWSAVQGKTEGTNWVALTYDGMTAASAKVIATGDDGVEGFKAILDEDRIIFGGIRVTAIDDRGTVKSVRSKYIFVQFIGSGVKPIARAKAGPMKSYFEEMLHGCHLSISISHPDDLSVGDLEQRLQANCGAHRPNRYEFGKKIVDEADF